MKNRFAPSTLGFARSVIMPASAMSRSSIFTSRVPLAASFATESPQGQKLAERSQQSRSPSRVPRGDIFDLMLSDFPSSRGLLSEFDFPSSFPFDVDTRNTLSKWKPRVDIHETDKLVTINCEVPGMKKEDIKIDLKDGTLTIKGEKKLEKKEEEDKYTRIERSYGAFQRRIGLPENIDHNQIKASYEHGVLQVTIPKTDKSEGAVSINIE